MISEPANLSPTDSSGTVNVFYLMVEPPGVGVVQAGIDKMPHEVAILESDGTIVVVNEAWRRFADDNHGVHPITGLAKTTLLSVSRPTTPSRPLNSYQH